MSSKTGLLQLVVVGVPFIAFGLSGGCAKKITGPEPTVEGLAPSLVCGDQLITEVAISGAGLSPLAIDAATEEPHLAIPDVTLRRLEDLAGNQVAGEVYQLPNDPLDPASARVRWTSETSMAFDVYPELGLESGLYEITLTNANGNSATFAAAITVVPKPVLEAVEPDMVCLEQGLRSVTLRGQGFLSVGAELPVVTVNGLEVTVDSLADCADLPGPTQAQTCLTAVITLAEDALDPGAPSVTITNPEPAACYSEEAVTMAIVPRPSLASVVPDLFCNEQGERTLTLAGAGFVTVTDGDVTTYPAVAIGTETLYASGASDCAAVAGTLLSAESCTLLTLVVPDSVDLLGEQQVVVTNPDPAGCNSEEDVTVAIVPRPVLSSVVPDLICNAETDRTLTLSGFDFIVIDTLFPDVTIDGETYAAETADGCVEIPGTLLDAVACDTLTVIVPEDAVGTGAHTVSVTNPLPAGCASTETITMAIVPEPTLASVSNDLFCPENSGGQTITLTGTGLVSYDDGSGVVLPTVWFDDGTSEIPLVADSVGGTCEAIDGVAPTTTASSCTEVTVTVPPATIPAGEYLLYVDNPLPVGCDSNQTDVTVFVAGAPELASVAPVGVCATDQPATMLITGTGFLRNDSAVTVPTVVVSDGSNTQTVTGVVLSSCMPLTGTAVAGALCTELTFDVPTSGVLADVSGFFEGTYQVTVTNPVPADCTGSLVDAFVVAPAPTIDDPGGVAPYKVCSDGDTFTVTGTGFVATSEILLDGVAVPTAVDSPTQLTGTIAPGFVSGSYDVQVSNGGSCVSNVMTGIEGLLVVDAPVAFFVDPPNIYSAIDVRVTVWVSGISGTDPTVSIVPNPNPLLDPPVALLNPQYDGVKRIYATLPAGTAAGDYDVIVDDVCSTQLANALHVTEVASVHISSIEPPFGVEDESTGVTIRSDAPTPPTFENFEQTPRAYLNPQTVGGVATEVRAVSFLSDRKLTGVIPDGLAPDVYQLIVVNPDGDVGVLDDAFTVLASANAPPQITELVPSQVTDQAGQVVTIFGANYPTAVADVEVTSTCRNPQAADPAATEVIVAADTIAPVDSTELTTSWNMSGLVGYVCVVRVRNLVAGTWTDFSALSVVGASFNINDFVPSKDMIEPRRALAGAAVRMNNQSRYLFAIGGDRGDDGINPVVRHSSVEAASLDPFGAVDDWGTPPGALQRNPLINPADGTLQGRSLMSAAVVNRHIYIAGGRVGPAPGSVDAAVLRAYLLDPFEAPEVVDLDLVPGAGVGLDGGIWYYRVAAVMDDGSLVTPDANNPGGEGLPSEPLVVQLPDLPAKVQLTLYWDPVPGAMSYRVYRSPTANGVLGDEQLLAADVLVTQFSDDGTGSFTAETPMPLGSLGVWHQVGTLATAREGAAIVAVPDPVDPSGSLHYLYVLGGRDSGGLALASYERVTITAVASNDQSVDAGGFQVGANPLDLARWQAGAVYLDARRSSVVAADEAWIYIMKGIDAGGGAANEIDVFQVDTDNDGELINNRNVNVGGGFAAFGMHAASNVIFGFATGLSPSNACRSGALQQTCDGDPLVCWPDLVNFNAGFNLAGPRHLIAGAVEGAFMYVLGGETLVELATRTTEQTNF